jgi:hypothetical protein
MESDVASYDGFTDASGRATFEGIWPARYIVSLDKPNYSFGVPAEYTVEQGAVLSIEGTRSTIRQIASVVGRESRSGSDARSAEDLSSQLAGGVLSNPFSLPDVAKTPGGALRLGAQGASTSTVTVDGAPIFPGGFAPPAALFASDLFSDASTTAEIAGAPGGAVQLTSFDPTLDWEGLGEYRPSSFGGDAWALRERGTAGHIGLSYTHAEATTGDALNGAVFSDASGLTYRHDTATIVTGDLFKVRVPQSATSVSTVSGGVLTANMPLECTLTEGHLPCGYGPGNALKTTMSFSQVEHDDSWSRGSLVTRGFVSNLVLNDDDARAQFLNVPNGSAEGSATLRFGGSVLLTWLTPGGRTLKFNVLATQDRSQVGSGSAAIPLLTGPSANTTISSRLTLPVVSSARLEGFANAGYDRAAGLGKAVAGLTIDYRPASGQSLSLDGRLGALGSPIFGSTGISLPSDLQFDCKGAALGIGPSASGAPPTEDSLIARYRLDRAPFQVSFSGQERIVHAAPVTGIVSASELPGSQFEPGYSSLAESAANAVCGTQSALAPNSLYFSSSGVARTLLEDGVDAALSLKLSDRARITADYEIDRARFFGVPSELTSFGYVTNGAQAPATPLQRANASFGYRLSPASSLIAQIRVLGSQNGFARYPFASVDAGVISKFAYGDALLGIENIGDTASPRFTTFSPFPYQSADYGARTLAFRLRIAVGNSYIDRNAVLNPPSMPTDPSVLSFIPRDFEDEPAKFLDVDTSNPFCGPEARDAAQSLLADVRAAVDDAEHARAPRNIPPRTINGVLFSYIRVAGGFAIRIAFPHDGRKIAPFLHCARLHSGDVAAASRLGVFSPDARTRFEDGPWVVYFAPAVGLYFAPEAIDATLAETNAGSVVFPSRVPIERLRMDVGACPRSERAAVEELLADLRRAIPEVMKGRPLAWDSDDFRIISHQAKGGVWLEIALADGDLADAFARCYDVPSAGDEELRAARLGGTNTFPSILYAYSVGLYRFRP